VIVQAIAFGFACGNSRPYGYFREASSVNFRRSVVYGLATLLTLLDYVLDRANIRLQSRFRKKLDAVISRYHRRMLIHPLDDISARDDQKSPELDL
jgi:hypothetical protein